MRIKHLLLSLVFSLSLWGQPAPALQDCVPSTLQFVASVVGYHTTEQDWIAACNTTSQGTDVDHILPAWNEVTMGMSKLIPIYVIPRIGSIPFDAKFERFRRIMQKDREVDINGRMYVWVGMHQDLVDPSRYYNHCAVAAFFPNYVLLISPNSRHEDGRFLEVRLSYPDFFRQTFIVFEVEAKAPAPNGNPRCLVTF